MRCKERASSQASTLLLLCFQGPLEAAHPLPNTAVQQTSSDSGLMQLHGIPKTCRARTLEGRPAPEFLLMCSRCSRPPPAGTQTSS